MERGHPVRQRAKHAQSQRRDRFENIVGAARSGGQDVRAPFTPLFSLISVLDAMRQASLLWQNARGKAAGTFDE